MNPLSLHPASAPAVLAVPDALRAHFDARHEIRVAGRGNLGAIRGWDKRHLPPAEARPGKLKVVDDAGERLFEDVASVAFPAGQFARAEDWDLAPSGDRAFVLSGAHELSKGRQFWSSPALYAWDLRDDSVELLRLPEPADGTFRRCRAMGDEDLLLLTRSALRWLRWDGHAWSEVSKARMAGGSELALGKVGGARIAAVRCVQPTSGASTVTIVRLDDEQIRVLGEVQYATSEIAVTDAVLVRREDGWYSVELPSDVPRAKKPQKRIPLELTLAVGAPPRVADDAMAQLNATTNAVGAPRRVGPDRVAALSTDGTLHLLDGGTLRTLSTPGRGAFDVSPTGRHAWVAGSDGCLWETRLDDAPISHSIPVEAAGSASVSGVASFDDDHLAVVSDETLSLLERDAGTWRTLSRITIPKGCWAHRLPKSGLVALSSPRGALLLFALEGTELGKVAEGTIPGATRFSSTAYESESGEIFVDRVTQVHRVHLRR